MYSLNMFYAPASRCSFFEKWKCGTWSKIILKNRENSRKCNRCTVWSVAPYSTRGVAQKLADSYSPSVVEGKLYDYWSNHGVCQPKCDNDNIRSSTFSLLLPPPNVTGMLHLGHSLTVTVQDVLARWHRMCGKNVLWVPGLDHAGIATQSTFEKMLWKERGETRHQWGREQFQKQLWQWQNEKRDIIVNQLRKMGVTLDWSKEYFTLDEKHSQVVMEAFIRLYESGLIYRSNGIVNWSCKLQSAISDIEVNHVEVAQPTLLNVPGYEAPIEFGVLMDFAYKSVDNDNELVVSTTRLETMLGDTAVAVHPDDERYTGWHGTYVWHPIRKESIPVVCDELVDPKFGTGVVKVTPAHSSIDYDIARRNNLNYLSVINEGGVMNELCGKYQGMKRFEARNKLKDDLSTLGLFRNQKNHSMSVPVCSRTGDVVEYLLKPQWFLSCKEMAEAAVTAVENGTLVIIPPSYKNVWMTWLDNIRDWCISRQLWWGHRIPMYKCKLEGEKEYLWIAAENIEQACKKAAQHLNIPSEQLKNIQVTQDEDVLDTWFSSALLPFSVHGWPHDTQEMNKFYPLSVMETGHDILFFWVVRMVMLGTHLTGNLPFKKVLLHGIVCDSHGRKMSKSLGNSIDPQDIIHGCSTEELSRKANENYASGLYSEDELKKSLESNKMMFPNGIPECGTDALRFTLCSHNVTSANVTFDLNLCHTNRLFCNKIWQACRYIERSYAEVGDKWESLDKIPASKMDQWIMSRLGFLVIEVNRALSSDKFHTAAAALKSFIYDEFCSTYLESTKPVIKARNLSSLKAVETLIVCMDTGLRALSPFMPFLSEHLYQHLSLMRKSAFLETIALASYPSREEFLEHRNERLDEEVNNVIEIISAIRLLKSRYNITKKDNPSGYVAFSSNNDLHEYVEYHSMICLLSGVSNLQITVNVPENVKNNGISKILKGENCVYLDVSKRNEDSENVSAKFNKYKKTMKALQKLLDLTSHPRYQTSTPCQVQKFHKEKISKLEAELKNLKNFCNAGMSESS